MRWLAFFIALSACAQPVEEPCLLGANLTERDASSWVENGRTILSVTTAECETGACIRDRTVPQGEPGDAARGYCAVPCVRGCSPGTKCMEVNRLALCLHTPP